MNLAFVLRPALSGREIMRRFLTEKIRYPDSLRALSDDTRGGVAIIFGLTIFVLFGMIGLAVDYARFVNARTQTIEATDAAVLAGARALQANGGDQAAAVKVAETYYQQATKNRINLVPKSDSIDFTVTDGGTAVITKGNAKIATPFMHLVFGPLSSQATALPLLRADGSDYSKAVLAVGGNGQTSLEVSMMLDITGSMAGQKLTDMKDAASDLVNIVVWEDQSKFYSKIAIVPFAYDVRLPTSAFTRASGVTPTNSNPSTCVVERAGSNRYTDTAPGANNYVLVDRVTKTTSTTKNGKTTTTTTYEPTCDLSTNEAVLPLTSDKSALLDKINILQTEGSTAGHIGSAWAWYMLSPKWGSLWDDSSSRPAAYGTDNLKKIAILMTDGEYNTTYTANGTAVAEKINGTKVTCTGSVNTACSASQAVSQCSAMKAQGIEVYTVGFQLGGSQLAINTLQSCATDTNHFYNSSTGDALKAAFRDIALKISTLYLSQ